MSSQGTLYNHSGAKLISRDDLAIIPAPEPTSTWYPVPHREVLDCVEEMLGATGLQIRDRRLSTSHEHQRFFGVLDLESPLAEGVSLSIGLRNSNDKSFPIGFCVGNRTFVCDNLAFSSEIIVTKRHTRFGSDRFREGIAAAVAKLADYRELEAQRIEQLQRRNLPDPAAESIVLRAWELGLVGTRLLRPLLDEWREPTFTEFAPRTAWSMLAAYTHIARDRQRRYPNQAAWEVMRFQSLLVS